MAMPKNAIYTSAYERMSDKGVGYCGNDRTYSRSLEIVILTQGNKKFYFVPYGEGYNCEGGIFLDILSQEEFDKKYSLEMLE